MCWRSVIDNYWLEGITPYEAGKMFYEDFVILDRSLSADGEYGPGQTSAYSRKDGGAPPLVFYVMLQRTASMSPAFSLYGLSIEGRFIHEANARTSGE